jgi:hypothetical protein
VLYYGERIGYVGSNYPSGDTSDYRPNGESQ